MICDYEIDEGVVGAEPYNVQHQRNKKWENPIKRDADKHIDRASYEAWALQKYGRVPPDFIHGMPYEAYLLTHEWMDIRRTVYWRFGGRCAACRVERCELDAHHRTYRHIYLESSHPNDLVLLCRGCHSKHHAKEIDVEAIFAQRGWPPPLEETATNHEERCSTCGGIGFVVTLIGDYSGAAFCSCKAAQS